MKYLVITLMLAVVLVSSVGAGDSNKHSSLYMDVTVHKVDGGRVTFINNVGDVFNFTDVTKTFKVGERTTLEFAVAFEREQDNTERFKVVDAFYVVQDTRFTYPDNSPDEWKMFVGIGAIMLAMLFGGFLLGRINNNKPRPNRRIVTV